MLSICILTSLLVITTAGREKSDNIIDEADTFLERLRALWKSSGGNRQPVVTENNPVVLKWKTSPHDQRSYKWEREESNGHSYGYRQLKVPVRLGLVRFSPRKPTFFPKINSDSSFPVLMPSDPTWARALNYNLTTEAIYRIARKASYINYRRNSIRMKRNGYNPEPDELPKESDGLYHKEEIQRDGTRWSDYFSGPEVAHDVCPSVSDWVARSEALDPYGNRLTVLQRIPVNGTTVNQYFFETYCASSGLEGGDSFHSSYYSARQLIECRGINKNVWNSRCKENFIWTYGKVITVSGDIGWSVIAIRGSCGCAIWRKPEEMIGRRRRLMRKPSRQG